MADIIIVEDEELIGMNTEMFLGSLGHNVIAVVNNGADIIKLHELYQPDLILMDIVIRGDINGIETTRIINDRYNTPVLYMTAHSDKATMDKVAATKHFGVLLKPFEMEKFQEAVESALGAGQMSG